MSKTKIVMISVVAALLTITLLPGSRTVWGSQQNAALLAKCPDFDRSNFSNSAKITNPFMPLVPGTLFIYAGTSSGNPAADHFYVTHRVVVVDGIKTLMINDTGYVNGTLEELTLDFLAQDNSGNVWYMGENASAFAPGQPVDHSGSWLAGIHGAQPGIVMEATSQVGDFYCQENSPGVAQDQALVLSVTKSVCTPFVCTQRNALLTKETSPLEPGVVEHKLYVQGVGNVLAQDVRGGSDMQQLVAVLHVG